MTTAALASGVVIRGLHKRYGETRALDGLDLDAPSGQITGVAGPNGAGKSTMVKVLASETAPDSGMIQLDGAEWSGSGQGREVAVVHQEPQLFPNLSVAENLVVGRESGGVSRPRIGEQERSLLRSFGIDGVAGQKLGALPLAVQQRVEIARALAFDARVVLFDEPNSALTEHESRELFDVMHRLAAEGRAIILVSHRLSELAAHARTVAIIVDGQRMEVLEGDSLTEERLARAIAVGAGDPISRTRPVPGDDRLTVEQWRSKGGAFNEVTFRARVGEIVAIVGVEGSGGREFVRSLAGFEPAIGRFRLSGSQADPIRECGYVAPDRRRSLFFNFGVGDNIVVRLAGPIRGRMMAYSRTQGSRISWDWIRAMRIKTDDPTRPVGSLSGGNQQKVVISAAMAPEPAVLVLEEPSRGVDIGSKREIYRQLQRYADQGSVVIVYCTEVPEAYELATTVYVMAGGQLSKPLDVAGFADEKALAAAIVRLER